MSVSSRTIKTSHADIAVSETGGKGIPTLLLHGNSAGKIEFREQFKSDVADEHRLIAIDLPGHGESSDAFDPERTYSMPGYADAVVELLAAIDVDHAAVFGCSLGGHVGLELLPRFGGLVGLMITGVPPVGQSPEEIQAGFKPIPQIGLAGKPEFTDEDVATFAFASFGAAADQTLRQAIVRTDGRARALMFASLFAGQASDQRELAVNSEVPIAIVNGADDPLVNLDYVGGLPYRNLWDKHCYVLRGAGHAPFLQTPDVFNGIFARFLDDMERRAVHMSAGKGAKTAVA